jgi:hypothetical protein
MTGTGRKRTGGLVRLIVISVTTGQRQRVFAFQIQHRWAPTPALEAILWPAAQPGQLRRPTRPQRQDLSYTNIHPVPPEGAGHCLPRSDTIEAHACCRSPASRYSRARFFAHPMCSERVMLRALRTAPQTAPHSESENPCQSRIQEGNRIPLPPPAYQLNSLFLITYSLLTSRHPSLYPNLLNEFITHRGLLDCLSRTSSIVWFC